MRMGHHADRCHSSEQALNQLLSVQRAFLEQRDETLNGVLHTLLLLERLHAGTITADAQRSRSPAGASDASPGRWSAVLGQAGGVRSPALVLEGRELTILSTVVIGECPA